MTRTGRIAGAAIFGVIAFCLVFFTRQVSVYKEVVSHWTLLSKGRTEEFWLSVGIYGWNGPRWRAPGSPFFNGFKLIQYATWRIEANESEPLRISNFSTVNPIAGLVAKVGDATYVTSSPEGAWNPRHYRVNKDRLIYIEDPEEKRFRESYRYLSELYQEQGWSCQSGVSTKTRQSIPFAHHMRTIEISDVTRTGPWFVRVLSDGNGAPVLEILGNSRPNNEPTIAGLAKGDVPAGNLMKRVLGP